MKIFKIINYLFIAYKSIYSVQDTQKWILMIDKLVNYKSKCPPEMLVTEVEEMIRDCVRSRKTAMLKDFKALDMCNVGIVCKDDFRNVLSKFVFRLTDKQVI